MQPYHREANQKRPTPTNPLSLNRWDEINRCDWHTDQVIYGGSIEIYKKEQPSNANPNPSIASRVTPQEQWWISDSGLARRGEYFRPQFIFSIQEKEQLDMRKK